MDSKVIMNLNLKSVCLPVAALLMTFAVAGCSSSNSNEAADKSAEVPVTVTDKGCQPNQLSVTSGYNTFVITNKSSQPLEWEILSGVKVIEERENIAPGFVQKLKSNLDAGEYNMVCGKPNITQGKLTVTAENGDTQAKASADQSKLVGAIAEYKVYVTDETNQLVSQTKPFTDAVIAGDLVKAQKLYAPARVHYERSEPIAELFSDLDKTIDSRADDFDKKEADPKFIGFHRLEKALFQDKTTKGMKPVALKLDKDCLELQKRISTLTIEPKDMVGGSAALIEEVAKTKISGEEDRYSRTDLWDFKSNIEGSQKIVELLSPMVEKANPALLKRIDDNFTTVNKDLDKYKTPDGGFTSYEKLADGDKKELKASVNTLAEDLSQLRGTLGVD